MLANKVRQFLTLIVFGTLSWLQIAGTGQAQFLDKLEAAVRAQLKEQSQTPPPAANPSMQTEDVLPAPPQSGQTKRTAPRAKPSDTAEGPALVPSTNGELLVPNPVEEEGVSNQDEQLPDAAQQRPTYLGIDAEEPVGGGIGVRVVEVSQGSPAWKAGFKVGDRILAVNGFAIADLQAMVAQLTPLAAGETVKFLISRGNRNVDLVAVLQDAELAARIQANAPRGPGWLGIVVNDLTPAFRQQFGVNLYRGAAITSVNPESPAARGGLRAGDAIAEVNGKRVERGQQLMDLLSASKPGDVLQIKVAQGGAVQEMLITLEEEPRTIATPPASARNQNRINNRPTVAPTLGNPPAVTTVEPLPFVPPVATVTPGAIETMVGENEPSSSARERELAMENASLRDELASVNQRLQATQQRLDAILKSLRQVTTEK